MLQYSKSRQSIWKNNLCKILKCHHFLIEPETTNYKFIVFNNRCSYYDNQHTLFLSNQRSAIKWCILWPAVIILPHPGENKEVFNTFQDLNWLFETQKDHFDFFFFTKRGKYKTSVMPSSKKILYFISSAVSTAVSVGLLGFGMSQEWSTTTVLCARDGTDEFNGTAAVTMGLFNGSLFRDNCPGFQTEASFSGNFTLFD